MHKLSRVFLCLFIALPLQKTLIAELNVFEKQSGDKITFNLAASSLLARQIEERAAADIFLSADESKMDGLQSNGLILKETRRDLLSNSLVIVCA